MNLETRPIPDIQILVVIGHIMAIEEVLRGCTTDATHFDPGGTTVMVPLEVLKTCRDFSEASRNELEQLLPPAGAEFSAAVANIMQSVDAPESLETQADMLAATSHEASVDSAKGWLNWFVYELSRLRMACGAASSLKPSGSRPG